MNADQHLLLIALGPVQSFIAQARRTRDLWYGSHLLSELGRAAARRLLEGGAELIFPALDPGDPELAPCAQPLRPDNRPPLSVANKLLARVPAEVDPAELARATREAVQGFWHDGLAEPVWERCEPLLAPGVRAAWEEQIATFLEFTAAWTPFDDASYAEARRELERTLAARKNLRDFAPWRQLRGNVPKSSLDGERETVLCPRDERSQATKALALRYRIAEGEQLDAVGLVKRAGGDPGQFVPLVNVALACWIARAAGHAPRELARLSDACAALGVARVTRRVPATGRFGFDASVLLPSRWRAVFEEQGLAGDPRVWGETHVRPLLRRMPEPYPYVVCLVADGDRMGQALDRLDSPDSHREFSRTLSRFAGRARQIVEQHLGSLVYAGGDDVLAFLPLPTALDCAADLRRAFAEVMTGSRLPDGTQPTLSVGIGVGHVMEGMGELLELGREAEHIAKRGCGKTDEPRDALAVVVDLRSGGKRSWRARWSERPDPIESLQKAITALEKGFPSRMDKGFPSRKVYEIAAALRRLPAPDRARGEPSGWALALAGEVRRSLSRVRGEQGVEPEYVGLDLRAERLDYRQLHRQISAWVERMLVARTFAAARPEPRPPAGREAGEGAA
jgi:CRISPR-associated protein Cmr2